MSQKSQTLWNWRLTTQEIHYGGQDHEELSEGTVWCASRRMKYLATMFKKLHYVPLLSQRKAGSGTLRSTAQKRRTTYALKPTEAWDPSQKGLLLDAPQRQSVTRLRTS